MGTIRKASVEKLVQFYVDLYYGNPNNSQRWLLHGVSASDFCWLGYMLVPNSNIYIMWLCNTVRAYMLASAMLKILLNWGSMRYSFRTSPFSV